MSTHVYKQVYTHLKINVNTQERNPTFVYAHVFEGIVSVKGFSWFYLFHFFKVFQVFKLTKRHPPSQPSAHICACLI